MTSPSLCGSNPSYLLGIEQGDLTALPGRPYALGFLRSYADYLGFDGDDLVDRIKAAVADLTDRAGCGSACHCRRTGCPRPRSW